MARIPAHEIEKVILKTVEEKIIEVLALDPENDHAVIEHINKNTLETEHIIKSCINKIIVHQEELEIDINVNALRQAIEKHLNLNISERHAKPSYNLSIPFTTRRSYKGAVILKSNTAGHDPLDLPPHELRNLIKGTIWREEHFGGLALSDIAERDKFSKQHVHQMIMKSMEIGLNQQ